MPTTYDQAIRDVRREIHARVGHEALAALHVKSGLRHALVVLGLLAAMGAAAWAAWRFGDHPWIWMPASVFLGFGVFAFSTLLHEVLHGNVSPRTPPGLRRALGFAYALPCGLSPSQFVRWHLDHHRWLGTEDRDPKRHYLSPKKNARWLKALYLTPALFPIYFRAAGQAARGYPRALQRRIRRERAVTVAFHLGVLIALFILLGPPAALRLYAIPVFLVFPVAFTLNRLGQHYDIDPEDPAHWGTLLRPSPFGADVLFLGSNYHLEHHLFPGVPCYRLPALRRALDPFFEARGIRARTYTGLLKDWFVKNRPPHTDWEHPSRRAALPPRA